MSNTTLTIGVLVAIVIAIGGYFYPQNKGIFGAVSPSDISATNFTEVTASNGMYIGAGGLTVNSGGLNLTTSNTATSTAVVGCVQMYATSTATAVHLEFSTSTALATFTTGTVPNGTVAWRYGVCPV